ncbi:hypothetical protein HT585_07925 [Ensifer sp. HO-A22]|uniref:Uncharacterized protein n=1 Tax=Ensifer oleiphilus TaxID=2742698 RepID=A0A7Y6UM52_9HYPH|nr:hypothetical protein [Ensifer oleiphilus]NVD38777.1 hypothetical protein [Ensifer oleiphilus]
MNLIDGGIRQFGENQASDAAVHTRLVKKRQQCHRADEKGPEERENRPENRRSRICRQRPEAVGPRMTSRTDDMTIIPALPGPAAKAFRKAARQQNKQTP